LDWENNHYQIQIIVLNIFGNQKATWHYLRLPDKNKKCIDNGIRLFHKICATISISTNRFFHWERNIGPLWDTHSVPAGLTHIFEQHNLFMDMIIVAHILCEIVWYCCQYIFCFCQATTSNAMWFLVARNIQNNNLNLVVIVFPVQNRSNILFIYWFCILIVSQQNKLPCLRC
jgi:hypothetical protein